MTFANVSGKFNSTIHRMDHGIFEESDAVVQAEPSQGQSPEILGLLASVGIKKGKPFKPDARMKKILTEAADVGPATVRALAATHERRHPHALAGVQVEGRIPGPGGRSAPWSPTVTRR